MKKISEHRRGFSTIELLFAFAIATIFLSGIFVLAFGGQTAALDSSLENGGLYRITTLLRDAVASTTKNWNVTLTTWPTNFYAQGTTMTTISPCLKYINATTTWKTEKNRGQNLSLGTFVSSTSTAKAMGGGCDPFPPSDAWDSPKKAASGISIASVNPTDVAVVPVNGKRIAILSSTASAPAKDDIFEVDVTDPQNPILLQSLNTGKGINAIAVGGSYAYAVQNDSTNQLQVIRLFDTTKLTTDPLYYKPALVTQTSLQNVAGAFPEGRSMYYYNNKLYIGTWNNNVPANSPEFLIYDVTVPSAPTFVGSNNLNTSVNDITVSGNYAYIATTQGANEFIVIDVSNPSAPTLAGSYDVPGSSIDAERVTVLGNYAYLGLDRATGNNKDFYVININTPTAPTLAGSLKLNMNNAGSMVTGIAVVSGLAFVGTTDSNAEFRVLNVSDPTNPKPNGCGPYNYSAKISALVYSNGSIITANQANIALTAIYDTSGASCN